MNAIIKSHFSNLISLAKADGLVKKEERKVIHKIGIKSGLSDVEIEEWLASPPTADFIAPEKVIERYKYLNDFIKIIVSDKELHENEILLLKNYASRLGFSDSIIDNSIEIMKRFVLSDFNNNIFPKEFKPVIN